MKLIISNINFDQITDLLKSLKIEKCMYKIGEYVSASMPEIDENTNQDSDKEVIDKPKKIIVEGKLIRKFKDRVCDKCGKMFTPTGARDKVCLTCRNKSNTSSSDEAKINNPINKPKLQHCPKCKKNKPITEFETEFSLYCKKCTEKVQNAPKLNLTDDEKLISSILALPISDRWDPINKLSYVQKQKLLSKLDINDSDEAERSFAQEFSQGLKSY